MEGFMQLYAVYASCPCNGLFNLYLINKPSVFHRINPQ